MSRRKKVSGTNTEPRNRCTDARTIQWKKKKSSDKWHRDNWITTHTHVRTHAHTHTFLDAYLIPDARFNLKWTPDLNTGHKTIKPLHKIV